jgi:hypothetical protein
MASNQRLYTCKYLSLCVYIGNTGSLTNEILFEYCSNYGTIVGSLFNNEQFCDFRLIEFACDEQVKAFLRASEHRIDRICLEVKLYSDLFTELDLLSIDRKFFIGPIQESRDVTIIVEFYKTVDSQLQHYACKQDNEIYLLLQFCNRQYVSKILEKRTMPSIRDRHMFKIHTSDQ